MANFNVTKSATTELLRQSIFHGTPGEICIFFQPDNFGEGWMFIRVKTDKKNTAVPIAINDGITIFAPESQIDLLRGLTLDHYQDLTGGGFLISTPTGTERSACGSGFKFKNH